MKAPTLSPQQAADRAGVSRKAIMDAIKAEKVRAWKSNESGRWEVVAESLQTWAEARTTRKAVTYDDTTTEAVAGGDTELANLRTERDEARMEARLAQQDVARLAAQLEREGAAHRDQVAELKADHREQLARRDADYREAMRILEKAQKRRGLLEWLGITGRRSD